MKQRSFEAGLAAAILFFVLGQPAPACGPFFPNNMLDRGDAAALVAPEADFARELERMELATSRFAAKPLEGDDQRASYANQSLEAELGDLLTALRKAKLPPEEVERIRAGHQKARDALKRYVADCEAWERSGEWAWNDEGGHKQKPKGPPPEFSLPEVVEGLPGEFADYFEGALAWQNPAFEDKGLARKAWERLLERPAAERKFKSTWAAFMLGKSWMDEDPNAALDYLQQVRVLAKRGFADSLGLAAASLGLEARIHLDLKDYDRAIEFYLGQFATGDPTAASSLRQVAREVLGTEDAVGLERLAAHSKAQRVITAFLVSRHRLDWPGERNDQESDAQVARWLDAVEAAGVRDVDSAEKLALAAYQGGHIELAQRWIKRAPASPVAQWLQAKLLLRAGKLSEAAALLAKVSRSFPTAPPGTNAPVGFADTLLIGHNEAYRETINAAQQVLGELGALHLARRQFTEALDALLRSESYWMDAAYVAERVLTVDELKTYVDRNWPVEPHAGQALTIAPPVDADVVKPSTTEQIRYLLARRLTRVSRGSKAREYFPEPWQAQCDALMQALNAGWDESQPTNARATALFTAAVITRTNGLELLGTEVEPDWAVYGGNYESGVTAQQRTNENFGVLRASPEELRRAADHNADPEVRFHYRYQAAFLAWEAAKLMPNNTDETARVLCTAGSWLKHRDPVTADLFYKALVRRCRKTDIGHQADQMRWFPVLDANGNPEPWEPKAIEPPTMEVAQESAAAPEMPSTEAAELGYEYVVQSGDTLEAIAQAYCEHGIPVTVEELIEANPSLDPAKLLIGQKIFIPSPKAEQKPASPTE